MTAHQMLYAIFNMFYDLLFNVFKVPNTNASVGWVFISALTMSMTIKALLNLSKSITAPKPKFDRAKSKGEN